MQPEILGSPTNAACADAFSPMRELPSPIRVVEHWEIVGTVVAFVVPIVFYGAFIFSKALKLRGRSRRRDRSTRLPAVRRG